MHVLMTAGAGDRRSLEDQLARADRKRRAAMAFLAGGGAMRSGEGKARLLVIEAGRLPPGAHVVTGVAGRAGASGGSGCAIAHLGLVRIPVARGAAQVLKLVSRSVVELGLVAVAIAARNGKVGAFEREARLVMARERELSRLKALH